MKYLKMISILMTTIMIGMTLTACSINAKDCDKEVYLGIKNVNLEQVKEGLEDGANINKIEGILLTESNPIRIALNDGLVRIANYLIEHGADANYTENSDVSLLMYSAKSTGVQFTELLLKYGAKIDQKDKNGDTALEYAVQSRKTEIGIDSMVSLLLKHGANISPNTLKVALKAYSDVNSDVNSDCGYGTVKRILEGLIKGGYNSELDPVLEAAILGETSKEDELIKANKFK